MPVRKKSKAIVCRASLDSSKSYGAVSRTTTTDKAIITALKENNKSLATALGTFNYNN